MDVGREVAQRILHSQLKPEHKSGNHINEIWRKKQILQSVVKEAKKEDNIKMGFKEIDRESVCWLRIKPIRNSTVTVVYVLLPKVKSFVFIGF
jgi:hypothetical protein